MWKDNRQSSIKHYFTLLKEGLKMIKAIFAVTSVVLGVAITPVNAQSLPIPGSAIPQVPFGSAPPPTQPIPNSNIPSNNVAAPFSNVPASQPHMTLHGQGNERNPSFTGQGYEPYKNQSSTNAPKK